MARRARPAAGAATRLVGDVGATNARFGLVSPEGVILDSKVFSIDDFPDIGAAIDAYLQAIGHFSRPNEGALAIAAAVTRRDQDGPSTSWSRNQPEARTIPER